MAEIKSGQYNFGNISPIKMGDITSVYAQVGQELNKTYYRNRQANIEQLDAVGNMKANKDDEPMLQEIQGEIIDGSKEFAENNNWEDATNYVFKTAERIVSDKALKKINEKYAQRQAYLQGLEESGWDEFNKNAFITKADLFSEAVTRHEDGTVTGGFAAIQYGKPLDTMKFTKDIADILSKAKASFTEVDSISGADAYVNGFAAMLNMDGEALFSSYLKTTQFGEGISYEAIASHAMNLMMSDPTYIAHLRTVGSNELFMKRFVADPSNPRGGTLSDITPDMIADIYKDSYIINALPGYGVSLSDIGSLDDATGTFTLNPNMSKKTVNALTKMSGDLGFDMINFLKNGESSLDNVDLQSMEEFFRVGFNTQTEALFDNQVKLAGIKKGTPEYETFKESFYTNMIVNNYINDTVKSQASAFGGLLSFSNTKIKYNVIQNNAFNKLYDGYQKKVEEYKQSPLHTGLLPDTELDINGATVVQERIRELGEVVYRTTREFDDIATKNDIYTKLKIPQGDTNALLALDLHNILGNKSFGLTKEEELVLGDLHSKQQIIAQANGVINKNKDDIQFAYDVLNDTKNYRSSTEPNKIFITSNGITTYDEYLKEYYDKIESQPLLDHRDAMLSMSSSPLTTHPYKLTKEQFKQVQSSIIDDAYKQYEKDNPGQTLKVTSNAMIVYNESSLCTGYIDNALATMADTAGDWTLESYQGFRGNKTYKDRSEQVGLSIAGHPELVAMMQANVPRSSSGTISSVKEFGLDERLTGFKDKVYDVENHIVFDSDDISGDGKRTLKIHKRFTGKNGETLGTAIVSRRINEQDYNNLLQSNYNKVTSNLIMSGNQSGTGILSESQGQIVSKFAQSSLKFYQPGSDIPTAVNTIDLQTKVNALRPGIDGKAEKMYLEVELNIPRVVGNRVVYEAVRPTIMFEKVGMGDGTFGTKMVMVGKNKEGKWIESPYINYGDGSEPIYIPELSSRVSPYTKVNDAFMTLANYQLMEEFKLNPIQYGVE